MKSSTTINKMLMGNKFFVPTSQSAYAWKTSSKQNIKETQINIYFNDLFDYIKSNSKIPYHFGQFLFKEERKHYFAVINGQQRLTIIIIFLAALFTRIKEKRKLTEYEEKLFKNMIRQKSTYTFSTVDYDNQLFRDYIIDQKKVYNKIKTTFAKKIIFAFDFFYKNLEKKDISVLEKLLKTISEASCIYSIIEEDFI